MTAYFTPEELQLKMSKKIAQLTKVIFLLNTRNEDARAELQAATSNYDKQLEHIRKDATSKLTKLKHDMEKKEALLKSADNLKKIKEKHEQEKQEAFQEFSRYKKDVQTNQKDMESKFQQKVNEMSDSVQALQSSFDQRVRQLRGVVESLETKLEKANEEVVYLNNAKAGEVADLVMSSNRKYNEMLAEQLHQQDVLKTSMEREKEHALEQQRRSFQEKMDTLCQSFENERFKDLKAKEQEGEAAANAVRNDLVSKMEKLLRDLEELRKSEEMLRRDKGRLQSEVEQHKAQEAQLREESARDQKTIMKSQAQLKEKCKEVEGLTFNHEVQLKQIRRELHDLEEHIKQKNAELSEARNQSKVLQQELDVSNAKRSESLAGLEETLKGRRKEVDALTTRNASLTLSLQEAQTSFALLEKTSHDLKAKLQDRIANAEKELEEARMRLKDGERREKELIKEQTELGASWEKKLSDARSEHAAALHQVKLEHDAKLYQLSLANDALEKNRKESQDENEKRWKELQVKRELEMEKMEKDKKALHDKQQELILEKKKIVEKYQTNIQLLENQVTALSKEVAALKLTDAKHEKAMADLRQAKMLLEKQVEDMKGKENVLHREYKTQLSGVHIEWEAKLKKERLELIQSTQQRMETAKNAMETEFAKDKETFLKHVNALEKDRDMNKEACDVALKAKDIELKALNERCQNELMSMKVEHQKELDALVQTWKTKVEDLNRWNDERTASLRSSHEKLMAQLMEEAREAKHVALLEEKRIHSQRCEDLQAEHSRELAYRLSEAENAKMKELSEFQKQKIKELHQQEERLEAEHVKHVESMKKTMQSQVDLITTKFEVTEKQLHAKMLALEKSQEELHRLDKELQKMAEEHSKICAAIRVESERNVTRLVAEKEAELNRMLEEHTSETNVLRNQFQNTRNLMADQIQQLKQQVCELEDQYAHRESREEDVQYIHELKHALVEKEALVQKTLEDMAYFKRELLNREESYNKTFSRSPNVGLLQVLKSKNGPQQQHQHQQQPPIPSAPNGQNPRRSKPRTQNEKAKPPTGLLSGTLPPLGAFSNNQQTQQQGSARDLRKEQ